LAATSTTTVSSDARQSRKASPHRPCEHRDDGSLDQPLQGKMIPQRHGRGLNSPIGCAPFNRRIKLA
jgi:hypothetical protein